MDTNKDRFPLLRKVLGALGLPPEAIDDIIDRILDWLSAKDEPGEGLETFPFRLRDDFLSNAEASFFQVLRGVVDDRALICPKVNLGDLFFVSTGDHRKNRGISNRIDRKHIDFLLCDPRTLRPILGIELDDKSHEKPERKARDVLVERVFDAARLPLVRIQVKSGYVPNEVATLIKPYLHHTTAPLPNPSTMVESSEPLNVQTDPDPNCPKCGSKMLLRTAKSGANAGGRFWGCSNFPRCRSMLPVKG